jgi:hypothetical protein
LREYISLSAVRMRWGSSYNIIKTLIKTSKMMSSGGMDSSGLFKRLLNDINQEKGDPSRWESVYIIFVYSIGNMKDYPENFNQYLMRKDRIILYSSINIGGSTILDSWDLDDIMDLVSNYWIHIRYSRTMTYRIIIYSLITIFSFSNYFLSYWRSLMRICR